MTDLTIASSQYVLGEENIELLSNAKNAKYLFDIAVSEESDIPMAVFWQREAHPEGSNYFGIFKTDFWYIKNAIDMATMEHHGIAYNGQIYHSRSRHDMRSVGDTDFFIDGGSQYLRMVGEMATDMEPINFTFNGGRLVVL